MRLDREIWEFSAGDAAGSLVPLTIGAAGLAALLYGVDVESPALFVGGLAVGCAVAAYLGVDLFGRLSALVDAHRERQAQTAAITPALLSLRAEIDLTRERKALVDSVAALNPEALDMLRHLVDDTAVITDTGRALWRIGGHEFSVFGASDWLEAMARRGGDIPADGDYLPEMYLSREDWRILASAMAEALRSAGVAVYAAGPLPPRWTTRSAELRTQAVNATSVYLAAQIAEGLRR